MNQAVVAFDAVGTLIAADPPVVEVYRRAAGRRGLELESAGLHHRLRAALAARLRSDHRTSEAGERAFWQGVIDSTFPELAHQSADLLDELWTHFALPQHWRLYDDVAAAWELLSRAGARLVVASNFDARLVAICQALPPLDRAEYVFTSSELGFRKPHAEFFRHIERRMGVSPQACTLVGDEPVADVEGALQAGWLAAQVRRRDPSEPGLRATLKQIPGKRVEGFDLLSLAEIILLTKLN